MAAPLAFPLRFPRVTSHRARSLLNYQYPMQPLALQATAEQLGVFLATLEHRIDFLRRCGLDQDLGVALLFQQQVFRHLDVEIPAPAPLPVHAGDAPDLPADAPAWAVALFHRLEMSMINRLDKLSNGTAHSPDHAITPIMNNMGVMPANADPPVYFPPTFGALAVLTAHQTTTLMNFYELDAPAEADEIDRRIMSIANHVGVRL